jgi:MFS transporter, DHA1 family, tetracycline resistance protein
MFLLVSLVGQTYSTVWVLFVTDRFHWTGTDIGLSLGIFGALMAMALAFAIGRVTRWLGERGTLLLGIACEATALLVLAFARASWIAFALIPLIAFGGIGAPVLRSLQSKAVDRERQGQLQGVIASFVSPTAIFGALVFSWIYALSRPGWTGLVWIVGIAVYALAVPLVLSMPKSPGERP